MRPALTPHREPAAAILEALTRTGEDAYLLGSGVTVGNETVPVEPGFAAALARMAALLERLGREPDRSRLGLLEDPGVAAALRRAHRTIPTTTVGGVPYRPNRFGVLLGSGRDARVVLATEPVAESAAALESAREDWDRAVALVGSQPELWRRADPNGLFENLLGRDRARGYDAGKRKIHLGLVLDALVPNLLETITLDLGGFLELALSGDVGGELQVAVALRDATAVNLHHSQSDFRHAGSVGPLWVVQFGTDVTVDELRPGPNGVVVTRGILAAGGEAQQPARDAGWVTTPPGEGAGEAGEEDQEQGGQAAVESNQR